MADEFRAAVDAGDDQPAGMFSDPLADAGASLTAVEIEARSTLARWLVPGHFPAVREQLISAAIDADAPDAVVDAARRLPAGQTFVDIGDAWQALGGREEPPPH